MENLYSALPATASIGDRALRRGVVAARHGNPDDQLLPGLGRTSPKRAEAALRPILGN